MNVSYKWLKEYVDFDLTPQETADALTSCGLEVDALEEVQSIKGGLKGLYVGKVLTCEAHPNSDHLHVTTVDLGKGEPQQIVCGAPNVAAGQKVIVADLGCVLYDGDQSFTIKKSKLRGVESLGMICAEDEIGVGTSHDGIIVLPEDAPVGQPAAEYYHLESDWLIEIDITANRADALGHWGVARDLYAWLKQNGYETSLHRPSCDEFVVDNEEATKQTIDEKGWYHTGDLGTMDGDGNVFIKGRSKNMLLGASGQNIYPEEIEDKLNSLALVAESVVVQKGEKLVGLVYPDFDEAQSLNLGRKELEDIMEQNRQELNTMVPGYSKLSEIRIHDEEFEKTPKKSIKRYLYTAE
jgi:tRNA-binding EMAP/Myf-like protein